MVLQLRAMFFHISLQFSLEYELNFLPSASTSRYAFELHRSCNVHPMEICSALLLKIISAWNFVPHKVFSLFWTLFLVSEVSVIYLLFFLLQEKGKKYILKKRFPGMFFGRSLYVFSHLIQCILSTEMRSFVLWQIHTGWELLCSEPARSVINNCRKF